ncbi:reverse transcriptase domain-containing protein, partial [Thiolapillus sp.]|uniref:reverse transcriptase domain-containing protein n=1 Tax=Thiolapillus sp. TaxID=2017437 RepID=UPI003AF94EB5
MANDVTILSVNCRGLADTKKRNDVFHYLKGKKYSIYCLQETHFTEEMHSIITSKWGYKAFFNSSSSNKKGLAILINNNFEFTFVKLIVDDKGDYMILQLKMNDQTITLINLHSPNNDDPAFYDRVRGAIKSIRNQELIVAGDWNLVLNPELDSQNYKHTNNPKCREKVIDLTNELSLVDIWRELNARCKRFTWRRSQPVLQQSRLDFFLINENLVADVISADIESGYRTDHSAVTITFRFTERARGRTFWKFNSSLLKDKEYVRRMKETIKKTKQTYAKNADSVDIIHDDNLEFQIDDQLLFEVMLMDIRSATISYATFKKRIEQSREELLIKEIELLEQNFNRKNEDDLKTKQIELEELRRKRMEGVLTRSRARWVGEGEKVSKYFCNLEKRHYTSKIIRKIEKKDGTFVTEQDDIVKETKSFYESLYMQEDQINDVNLEDLIQEHEENIPKLTEKQRNDLEGLISKEEVLSTLKRMKNGTSPGSDGFTVEFYKFFWNDLGSFLVRAINESFKKESLSSPQKEGIITLLPKGDKPRQFLENWRPITLLNVSYKIASGCIANRIKRILPDIIHSDQTGFVSGRCISENTRLLYDVIHYTEKRNVSGLLLLIDFEKAFDSVSWSFIKKTLNFLKFGPDIKKWIDIFYKNTKSCVIVNGQVSTWFSIERGCRQGDPLSP